MANHNINVDQEAGRLMAYLKERGLTDTEALGVLAAALGRLLKAFRGNERDEFQWRRILQEVHKMIDANAYHYSEGDN